jgi:sporulation protein YlmC with PRC-barrel domain
VQIIVIARVGVGGFLGIGEKDVAVPFNDLKVSSRDNKDWLVLNKTKEELKAESAYVPEEQKTGRSVATPNWRISDIYKADVYDKADNKIGKITDLVMDRNGNVVTAAIKVGDFLGAGKKEVAIPFQDLKVSSREGKDWIVLDKSKNELMNAPAFEKKDFEKKDFEKKDFEKKKM